MLSSGPADVQEWLPLTDLSYQVLLAVSGSPLHGYAILQTISGRTGGRIEPESGTLYTAIRRLRRDGLIEAVDVAPASGDSRRGRSYGLTALGRRVLVLESERLADLVEEARERRVLTPSSRPADV